MRFQDMKYAVQEWITERRFARGPLPLIVISVVLAASVIWIGSFLIGGDSYPMPKPPASPRHVESARLSAELHADERFRHVSVSPSGEDENAVSVTGEVYTSADKAALEARIRELQSTFTLQLGEIVIMNQ